MEILAEVEKVCFEFFSGDFLVFGFIAAIIFIYKSKKEDDFYG